MTTGRLLLRCPLLLPAAGEPAVANAGVLVEQSMVASVGHFASLRRAYPLAPVLELSGVVVVPGLVDAHSHARGIPMLECGIPDAPLDAYLLRFTALPPFDAFDSAFVAASDLLATGVTSVQAMFHSFTAGGDYATAARATLAGLARAGIQADVVLGITDRDEYLPAADPLPPPDELQRMLEPSRGTGPDAYFALVSELLAEARPQSGACHRFHLGPVAPQWCAPGLLKGLAASASAHGARIHTHLLESPSQRHALPDGESPAVTLASAGLLGPATSVAHGGGLTRDEWRMLAAHGTAVVHCPGSNTRLSCGHAPLREWLDDGVEVGIGLDSHSLSSPPDMFAELRHARTVAHARGSTVADDELLRLATAGGASAMGVRDRRGALAVGASADAVALRAGSRLPSDPTRWVIEETTRQVVEDVWVAGRRLVEGGRLVHEDAVRQARRRLRATVRAHAATTRAKLAGLGPAEEWVRAAWQRATGGGRR